MEKEIYIPKHLKKNCQTTNVIHKKKPVSIIKLSGIVCLLVTAAISFCFLNRSSSRVKDQESESAASAGLMPENYRTLWLKNKVLNPDYIGEIVFDSGLVSLSFVQAEDVYDHEGRPYLFYSPEGEIIENVDDYTGNDVYIWKNWKTGRYDRFEEGGSVFMDYRNTLNDQNLIIYGHHFARDYDPSGRKQFTPLDLLLKQENYEENRTLKLVLDNEIRTYEICAVLAIDATDDRHLQIVRPFFDYDLALEYDPGFFDGYIALIDQLSVYPTGIRISRQDRFLSLITCIEHQPDLREAVICRQTGVEKYETAV